MEPKKNIQQKGKLRMTHCYFGNLTSFGVTSCFILFFYFSVAFFLPHFLYFLVAFCENIFKYLRQNSHDTTA